MYAVIETGGKQYCVQPGMKIAVEKLALDQGAQVTLDKVLLVGGDSRRIGAPYVEGVSVTAEVAAQRRGPKVIVFKRRRRKDSKSLHGHRQDLTELLIKEITG